MVLLLRSAVICCLVVVNRNEQVSKNSDSRYKQTVNDDTVLPNVQILAKIFSNDNDKSNRQREQQSSLEESSLQYRDLNGIPTEQTLERLESDDATVTVGLDIEHERTHTDTKRKQIQLFTFDSLLTTSVGGISSMAGLAWNYVTKAPNPEEPWDLAKSDKTQSVDLSYKKNNLETKLEEKDMPRTQNEKSNMEKRNEIIIETKEIKSAIESTDTQLNETNIGEKIHSEVNDSYQYGKLKPEKENKLMLHKTDKINNNITSSNAETNKTNNESKIYEVVNDSFQEKENVETYVNKSINEDLTERRHDNTEELSLSTSFNSNEVHKEMTPREWTVSEQRNKELMLRIATRGNRWLFNEVSDVEKDLKEDNFYNDDRTVIGNDNNNIILNNSDLDIFYFLLGDSGNKPDTTKNKMMGDFPNLAQDGDDESASVVDTVDERLDNIEDPVKQLSRSMDYRPPISIDRFGSIDEADLSTSDISNFIKHFEACDTCMVTIHSTSSQCPYFSGQASEFDMLAREFSDALRYGCSGSGVQHKERCCHVRDPNIRNMVNQISQVIKSIAHALLKQCEKCPDDCVWSEWESWSSCSDICGQESFRSRSRSQRREKRYRGRPCSGNFTQQELCPEPKTEYGTWQPWTSWSACSSTCGGTKYRTRQCRNPSTFSCFVPCSNDYIDVVSCGDDRLCCQPATWGPWGTWSECIGTHNVIDLETGRQCGQGCKSRSRECKKGTCLNDTCYGDHIERLLCKLDPCCAPPVWTMWGQWSPCSVSSGAGFRKRSRLCQPDPNKWRSPVCRSGGCYGQHGSEEADDCRGTCTICVPPVWSSWDSWSECSFFQNKLRRTSKRYCRSVSSWDPYCRHLQCDGDMSIKAEECICDQPFWTSWSEWEPCDETKTPARKRRHRRCNQINDPKYCSVLSCIGPWEMFAECCSPQEWLSWEQWTLCDHRSYHSKRSRHRVCSAPSPGCQDQHCVGSGTESAICHIPHPTTTESVLECQESCIKRVDGKYPSCKYGCRSYITCCQGHPLKEECQGGQHYDSLCKKCRKPPSPTCPTGHYDLYRNSLKIITSQAELCAD